MSTPDERIRALKNINEHLTQAFCGTGPWEGHPIKRIPARLKNIFRMCIRHYPSNTEIDLYWKEK
jgi:hypothetical protein